MNDSVDEKAIHVSPEIEQQRDTKDNNVVYNVSEKLDYNRGGAIDAENIEHQMGVLEAVRAYPAASWWAFVMSATIVSPCPQFPGQFL